MLEDKIKTMFKKILWLILGAIFTLILVILSTTIATLIDTSLGFYPNNSTPSIILYIIGFFILLFVAIKIRRKNRAFSEGICLSILLCYLGPCGNMNYRRMIEHAKFEIKVASTTNHNLPTGNFGVYIPENLEDCFQELQKMLPSDFLKQFKSEKENRLSKYHPSLELWVVGKWDLYSGDESRLKTYFNQLGIFDDDDMSKIISLSFWRHLNNRPLDLEKQIKYYRDRWNKRKNKTSDNIVIGLFNIFIGLLFIILCVPLVKRKIKMNSWYGIRIPKSFKSEENWYKINEYGGKIFIYWSIPIVLIGIVLLFLPQLEGQEIILMVLLGFSLLIIPPTIQLRIYSRKI